MAVGIYDVYRREFRKDSVIKYPHTLSALPHHSLVFLFGAFLGDFLCSVTFAFCKSDTGKKFFLR